MKSKQVLLLIYFISTSLFAQSIAPQLDEIKLQDLKDDLYELAGNALRGRRGRELGEMLASVCLAQKAREAGLKPAGEDGTCVQFFNFKGSRMGNSSTITLNGKTLDLWKEIWPTNLVDTSLEGSVVWLDKIPDILWI